MTTYTIPQIYQMALNAGFAPGNQAAQATAVAMGESSGNDNAMNTNSQPLGVSTDYGLMQVNSKYWGSLNPSQDLGNAQQSMNNAYSVYTQSGNSFSPWISTNGKNGAYNAALPQAQAYAAGNTGLTGASAAGGSGTGAITENDPYSDLTGGDSTIGGTVSTTGNIGGGSYTTSPDGTINISEFSTPATADFGDLPDNIFDGAASPTVLPSDAAAAVGSVNASTLASSLSGTAAGTAAGAGGIAVNLTDESQLPSSVSGAGTAVQKGATTAGSDIETSAGGIAGTAASIVNAFTAYTSSAFVTVALVALGLIFVAFGLGLFKHSDVGETISGLIPSPRVPKLL